MWTDAVTMDEALEQVVVFVEQGDRPYTVFATNPEKNFSVPRDPFLYDCFRQADLLLPDGIGMVLGARLLHGAKLERVPGCEFMQRVCGLAAERGYKIFLYGAKEAVSVQAMQILQERYPGIQIVGRCNGYWPDEKMGDLVKMINDSGAQILFLALGSPKQEQWFARHREQLPLVRVVQGIGGTLDVIAGTVKRAPAFFCAVGLEWLYRLLAEPKRIGRQKVLPLFALQVLGAKLKMMVQRS